MADGWEHLGGRRGVPETGAADFRPRRIARCTGLLVARWRKARGVGIRSKGGCRRASSCSTSQPGQGGRHGHLPASRFDAGRSSSLALHLRGVEPGEHAQEGAVAGRGVAPRLVALAAQGLELTLGELLAPINVATEAQASTKSWRWHRPWPQRESRKVRKQFRSEPSSPARDGQGSARFSSCSAKPCGSRPRRSTARVRGRSSRQ